jgi:hypothetical protein
MVWAPFFLFHDLAFMNNLVQTLLASIFNLFGYSQSHTFSFNTAQLFPMLIKCG